MSSGLADETVEAAAGPGTAAIPAGGRVDHAFDVMRGRVRACPADALLWTSGPAVDNRSEFSFSGRELSVAGATLAGSANGRAHHHTEHSGPGVRTDRRAQF